jgi:hypothetical protein
MIGPMNALVNQSFRQNHNGDTAILGAKKPVHITTHTVSRIETTYFLERRPANDECTWNVGRVIL